MTRENTVNVPRLYDKLGYMTDPEGLGRIRRSLLETADWHDRAPINCNSLARLLDTIEILKEAAAPLHEGEGEPVAWRYRVTDDQPWLFSASEPDADLMWSQVQALYAAPPPSVEGSSSLKGEDTHRDADGVVLADEPIGAGEPIGNGRFIYRTTLLGERHVVDAATGFVWFKLPYDYRYTDNATQRRTVEAIIAALAAPASAPVAGVELAREALQNILKVTGMTPQDVVMQQRGIAHRALEALGSSSPKSEDTRSAAERLAVAEAEIARLTAANNDLRSIPWPRAYVLERASEWKRLLREVNGYLKTCRGSCGSDMAGRDHAIAASDALITMLAEATPPAASVSTGMETLQASECTKEGDQ